MGLRIVDRRLTRRGGDISDQERLSGLEHATHDWFVARGKDVGAEAEFVARFRKVREQLKSPSTMVEMATKVREGIKQRTQAGGEPHSKVDVATLLELL
jgi:hypothetical protein